MFQATCSFQVSGHAYSTVHLRLSEQVYYNHSLQLNQLHSIIFVCVGHAYSAVDLRLGGQVYYNHSGQPNLTALVFLVYVIV
jgi:hypothetical protein